MYVQVQTNTPVTRHTCTGECQYFTELAMRYEDKHMNLENVFLRCTGIMSS